MPVKLGSNRNIILSVSGRPIDRVIVLDHQNHTTWFLCTKIGLSE